VAVTYTLSQMVDDTLRQLRGTMRERVNILAASIDAPPALTVENIQLTGNLDGVVISTLLSIGDETMYVLDITPASLTAQVIRGYDDTIPAVASAGALVRVDTPWPRATVQEHIKDEIRSWGPQVFAIGSADIPIVNLQRGYDLSLITTPIIRILKVTAPSPPYVGDPGYWAVPGNSNTSLQDPSQPFTYNPNANLSEFPSGKSITLTGMITPNYAGNLHVVYATPFDVDTLWTDSTDMIANVGLDSRDLDIPPLGAAARLLRWLSVRRAMLNVQGASRSDQDVTMPTILQAVQNFQLSTKQRLNDVQQRLLSDWPVRQSGY
jgi:hypothetical protein